MSVLYTPSSEENSPLSMLASVSLISLAKLKFLLPYFSRFIFMHKITKADV